MPHAHLNLNLPAGDKAQTTPFRTCACARGIRASVNDGHARFVDVLRIGVSGARAFRHIGRNGPLALATTLVGDARVGGPAQ